MIKLGGYVHCTKILPEFECQGQRSKVKVTRYKKDKKQLSHPHWRCIVRRDVRCKPYAARSSRLHCVAAGRDGVTAVHVNGGLRAVLLRAVLTGRATLVGKSAHAV